MEYLDSRSTSEEPQVSPSHTPALLNKLRQENDDLQKQLNATMMAATDNEKIWRHFVEIERILFRTRQLEQLTEELLREIKTRFQLDVIVLFLSHPDLLDWFFPDISEESEPIGDGTWILPLPPATIHSFFHESFQPLLLSSHDLQDLEDILPKTVDSLESGVLVPLCIHQILFGGILLGSHSGDRYQPKDGTDLLEQLGIKIALCMDNCLTYEKLKQFAVQEYQTDSLNFFQIHTALETEFQKARRHQTLLSLLVIDLDFFQATHANGDTGPKVIRHVAALLNEVFSEDEMFIGRYGSDEFMVLLPGIIESEAREIASYLTHEIRRSPFNHENTAILIQATIGTATLENHMMRPSDLLDTACTELYRMKLGGRRTEDRRQRAEDGGQKTED